MSDIVLESGSARARVALRGAELCSWEVGDTALIWTPQHDIWADTAPILFPVVGWTKGSRILVDDRSFPLGLHGFARHAPFAVVEQWPSHVRLELVADANTRQLYPFDFSLQVEHILDATMLTTRLTVGNTGARALPYACGLHPGFCWPFAGGALEDYAIVFEEREATSVPMIASDGLFTHQTRRVPLDGRRLGLCEALFAKEALCFLDSKSRSLRFVHGSGAALEVALDGFPHIALWSRPAGRFLSIEAWTGHGDFVDADGDLFAKPSMLHLAPGASAAHAARYAFSPAHRRRVSAGA